ncbi:hypothetical protein BU16DRAFT_564732 [Lophium mytilinum]|uniref:Uncharacterized protein n=1 Tax=Lophium mytilinum TaxID=390894 RepID=A0A6A6QIN7_9PEZI|nr:hypothetical protein BU16DRAFT_564732 [Lophium mytilinum]
MDIPLIILPAYLQERVQRLPSLHISPSEMEESVRPCAPANGSLYHILRCGHKIRTTEPQPCGQNCRIFFGKPEFCCRRCVEKEVRQTLAIGGELAVPEEEVQEEVNWAIQTDLGLCGKRAAETVTYRDPVEDYYRDRFFPELAAEDYESTEMQGVERRYRRTSARVEPWNPEIWNRFHQRDQNGQTRRRRYTLAPAVSDVLVDDLTEDLRQLEATVRDEAQDHEIDVIDNLLGHLQAGESSPDAETSR